MSKKRRNNAQSRARDRPEGDRRPEVNARAGGVTGARLAWSGGGVRQLTDIASSETIYAAVLKIANALGTMPVHLYRRYERMAEDPRDYLLSLRPNRRQSAFAFKQAMEICRCTEGRAYAIKRLDASGQLAALECWDPLRVTPYEDEATHEIWYRVTREDGGCEWLHNWYVLDFFHASTNGVTGVRVMDVLAGTVQYSEDVKAFSLENLKNVSNAIVMDFPTTFESERRVRAVKETLEIYRANGGKIIALDAGVKASMLGGSAIEAAAFDVEGVTRSRVAMVYGLPPHMLGDYRDATAGTIEGQNIEFLTTTMNPIVQQWVEQLNYKLLTPQERRDGYTFRFDMESYLRADGSTLATVRQAQIRCGMRTVNEIRAAEHLAPVEGGDVAFASKDLAPVKLIADGGTIDLAAIAGEHNSANTAQEDGNA